MPVGNQIGDRTLHGRRLRHASRNYSSILNEVIVAEFAGHSGLETIQDYVDVSIEQKREQINTLKDEYDKSVVKKWSSKDTNIRVIAGTKR